MNYDLTEVSFPSEESNYPMVMISRDFVTNLIDRINKNILDIITLNKICNNMLNKLNEFANYLSKKEKFELKEFKLEDFNK